MVSYLRSCYSTKARFFADRPDIVSTVVWQWCEPDAPPLPYDNVFTARTWYDNFPTSWPLLGEVDGAPRVWRNGDAVGPLPRLAPCGQQAAFINGVPYALANSAPVNGFGQLVCCTTEADQQAAIAVRMDYPI